MNEADFEKPANPYPRGPKSTWTQLAIDIREGKRAEVVGEIPALLCWLEDYNWRGAHDIAAYLIELGAAVVPHARRVLGRSRDTSWQYRIIVALIQQWPRQLVVKVERELSAMAYGADSDEAHLVALELLVRHGLLDHQATLKLTEKKAKSSLT